MKMKIQLKNKKSNSRQYFENNRNLLKSRRSQAELITTVLLILVSIAAVVLVSGFVINMVRDYLKPTDCFKTTDHESFIG